jgi:23S rRNA-/tRNA-specific pseudouridylate synthase
MDTLMDTEHLTVEASEEGSRADRFLTQHFTDCSRSYLQKLISQKMALLN